MTASYGRIWNFCSTSRCETWTVRQVFAFAIGLLLLAAASIAPATAGAAVCPNANPVVNENQCKTGSSSWEINEYSKNLGGFTTQSSVNLGESVVLKIARNGPVSPTRTVKVDTYRMGWYGGLGGRLVNSASNVAINNEFACKAMNETTGLVDCGNWAPTYTIPASAFPASGIYLAKLTASTGDQTQVVFTVRDDKRTPASKAIYVLPVATYQAYNIFGGKSLYFGTEGGNTAAGTDRAVKVSFNRPYYQAGAMQNWFLGPDFELLSWLEKQGYDVSYTDDVAVHNEPALLRQHDIDVVSGHAEYWSLPQFDGFLAARNAGVNIASFSGNTAYWKVRYEDGNRTLVCYKTVQGSGTAGNGTVSDNDWGPDGIKGTTDDALGLDGKAGTADDNPQNSTTTFRDNGAPPGDPSAPAGGRVGPDRPENQLFGVMYVGDNDSRSFPLTIPARNANEEFAADRVWRNTGVSENTSTSIGTRIVGWEWDAVPTQAQYTSRQPSGVIKLSSSNVQTAADNSWLQDEGRLRNTTPPPGQPGTINAVKYTAASGAEVFASGTMYWSQGLSNEPDDRIEQATYNVFSEMGTQPDTPEGIILDPGGSNRAPNGSFTVNPNPTKTNTQVSFDATGSTDPDGTVVKYEWDLDGNGSFETNSGSNQVVTRSYASEGAIDVRLRVTDNGGATDLAVETLTVLNNQPPSATLTATPNTPIAGEAVSFSAAGSKDPDGTIAKYEWDLDGNGTYETSTGTTPAAIHTYSAAGEIQAGLRVTDNGGKTATATATVTVLPNGVSNYSPTVSSTPGLVHYWRMNEASGSAFADGVSAGSSPAATSGEPTLGVAGGIPNDSDKAARFDGVNDAATAAVNLAGTKAVTVEFWLKWNAYSNDDRLAMELTKNFNEEAGGLLVDPNAPQLGGTFGVGIGLGTSRNNVFFTRPSAGVWHHYAFVLDTAAAASQQITPYVDGKPVTYTKLDSGTGAGNFANSNLYLMSRAAAGLFGAGDLDEVALYNRALEAATIDEHFNSDSANKRPKASFTAPLSAKVGETVGFNAAASSDPDGTVVKYEWDLDGNGSFETNTGTTSTASKTYTAGGSVVVGLRVTDNEGATGTTTRTLTVEGENPPEEELLSNYSPTVLDTPGIAHYWRLDETSGTSFADSVGTSTATAAGGVTLGVPGGIPHDSDKAARFDGVDDAASAPVDLSGKGAATVEFWLKWNAYANDDRLAMEFTSNFNEVPGGFLVDPNAPQFGGTFGVGIGSGSSRNNVFFARPSAGAWHHYVFVLDTTAPPAEEVTPYVDGLPIAYTKVDSGAGAPAFAKSNLYFMSRAASGLFGAGDLDEVALYERALSAATVAEHFNSESVNKRPSASFQAPAAAKVGEPVSFDASASKDTDGAIAKYEWDLDGNGTYETSTGTAATAIRTYTNPAAVNVHLRVTDDKGGTGTAVRVLTIEGEAGEEEGAKQPTYAEGIAKTAGLLDYWRLGEAVGPALLDSAGSNNATAAGGATVGVSGALAGDPDTAVRFDGVDATAGAPVQLGGKTAITVSFWLKWSAYANDDRLAMELTDNFNDTPGGFLVDPNSSYGSFAVGIGNGSSRNVSVFPRPSAGQWHHYAFALDTQAPAAEQVVPYVDGQAVPYTKVESGTGAPAFADANLSMMSRASSGLFGAGDLDEVALFGRTLSAAEIANQYALSIPNSPPEAAFTATPNPAFTGATVTFNGSASKDPDGAIAKYVWDLDGNGTYETDTGTASSVSRIYLTAGDRQIGLKVIDNKGATAKATRTVTIQNSPPTASFTASPNPASVGATVSFDATASKDPDGTTAKYEWDLDGNGTYEIDTGTTAAASSSYATIGERTIGLRVTDNAGATATSTKTLVVQNTAPTASFTAAPETAPTATAVSFDAAASKDPDGTIAKYEWDLDGNGTYETNTGTTASATTSYATPGARTVGLRVTDNGGATATTTRVVTAQNQAPSASFSATPNPVPTGTAVSLNASGSSDPDGTVVKYEWDLDGNGTYETNAGTTATISRTFTPAGEKTLGLRVTDNSGAIATTTRTLIVTNRAPTASFTVSPNPVPTGTTVTFNGSGSSDPDGTVAKYEWDLDGNGTYETSTGATSSTTRSYVTAQGLTIGLRVIDNLGSTATTTRTLTVTNRVPTASFTASPNPALAGATVSFNAGASSDPDGAIAKYEWDLDGNGTYETNTGITPTTSRAYATGSGVVVGLRVTDNLGAAATTTQTLVVRATYEAAVRSTTGLVDYWRLGETSGTSLADAVGGRTATARNGVTLGTSSNLTLDSNTAASFDGVNDNAAASVNLSGTSKATIEFWMKWTANANNDDLAFEFTANNTVNNGAFVINPNSTTSSSRFEVAIGRNGSRNNIYFARPSAGVWHHYAIVLNTTAAAAQQILPYVDGEAVSFVKGSSGTGAGNFANSTLNFMSRNGSSLFGAGSLDEVAIYTQALTAAQISQHFAAR
jgi:YD repeat-containing protein